MAELMLEPVELAKVEELPDIVEIELEELGSMEVVDVAELMLEPVVLAEAEEPPGVVEIELEGLGRVEVVDVPELAFELLELPEMDELLTVAEFELEEMVDRLVDAPELALDDEEPRLGLEGLLIVLEAVLIDDELVNSPGHVDTSHL